MEAENEVEKLRTMATELLSNGHYNTEGRLEDFISVFVGAYLLGRSDTRLEVIKALSEQVSSIVQSEKESLQCDCEECQRQIN